MKTVTAARAIADWAGAAAGQAMFDLKPASRSREVAAITTQRGGEVIPADKPVCLAMALREPVLYARYGAWPAHRAADPFRQLPHQWTHSAC